MTGKRPLYLILMGVVLSAAVLLRVWDPVPVARARLAVFDTLLAASPRIADPAYPVRIVDIDEASLAVVGQWPWPRTKLAAIIERLQAAGAKTIAVDLILAEPDRWSAEVLARALPPAEDLKPLASRIAALPSNDQVLAGAIAKAPVVLGFSGESGPSRQLAPARAPFAIAGDDPKSFVAQFSGGVGSVPVLSEAATGLGAVNWLPETDQIVRRVPLLVTAAGQLYPSLALETLRIAHGPKSTIFVKSSGASGILAFGQKTGVDSIRTGQTILPADGRGELWLRFAAPNPQRYISARTILDGTFDAQAVAGRHIFIGASATGLLDLRATPLAASVPGVEIHAQALEQMLAGDHLVRPAWATGLELVFLVTAGALAAWLIGRSGVLTAAAAIAAAIAGVAAFSWAAYTGSGLLFDPVFPSLALGAVYVTGSLSNYLKAESDRAQIRSAFGHYVSPAIVDELAQSPDRLKLGGEDREVTVLFADVRGFSKLSEGMNASELVRFVNELFTPLADEILAHRGTIDKFMGDAVMAFWNAPLADPNHAAQACRAALAMQAAVAAFNTARAPGTAPVRLGIGLNTGPCVVGNVGSPQRFDYSVLGDVVNTAARIEEATKTYGAAIIVGAETAKAVPDFALIELGTVALRGKDRGESLYALIGDERVAAGSAFDQTKDIYARAAAAVARGDRGEALAAIQAFSADGLHNVKGLFEALQRQP